MRRPGKICCADIKCIWEKMRVMCVCVWVLVCACKEIAANVAEKRRNPARQAVAHSGPWFAGEVLYEILNNFHFPNIRLYRFQLLLKSTFESFESWQPIMTLIERVSFADFLIFCEKECVNKNIYVQ